MRHAFPFKPANPRALDVHNIIHHQKFRFFIGLEGKTCEILCGNFGRVFLGKMAGRLLPGHDELFEIFNDSGSEDEFEGFELEDGSENIVREQFDGLSIENWTEGDREPTALAFTATPGLTAEATLPVDPQPIDFFHLFFHQSDFEKMAEESNRYADTFLEKNRGTLKQKSRFQKWTDDAKTTWQEMKIFVAMLIAMGLTVQLAFSEYWTTDEVTETPFYRKLMSRDRAYLLMSFFHLADNSLYVPRRQPGHNPLHKLGDFYTNLISRFSTVYVPSQHLSLDEGMIPWRGHLSSKAYSPDKPHKYGIKAHMVCDAKPGYCVKFKLYTGKTDLPATEHGATYDLVFDMMRGYFGQGYVLYMDNYYSSLQLYWDLWRWCHRHTESKQTWHSSHPQGCAVQGEGLHKGSPQQGIPHPEIP